MVFASLFFGIFGIFFKNFILLALFHVFSLTKADISLEKPIYGKKGLRKAQK